MELKKYLMTAGIGSLLLLAACNGETEGPEANTEGDNNEEVTTEETTEEMTNADPTEDSVEEMEVETGEDGEPVNMMAGDEYEEPEFGDYEGQYEFDLENATDDIMEFASNDKIDVFVQDDWDAYKKNATYSGEVTDEDGMYRTENNGYEESLRFMLVEDQEGTQFIAIAGEQVNYTDNPLSQDQLWRMTTDTMEQTNTEVGTLALGGTYEPNTRHRGMSLAPLEFQNETPQKINVTTGGVLNVQEDGTTFMEDYFVEPKEFTLTIVE